MDDFDAKELQPLLCKKRASLVIQGPGGVGKTSLACQIASWVMAAERSGGHATHPMLPVLIEEELEGADLVEIARGKLRALVEEAEPVTPDFFAQLLRKKRVIMIVDHLSEMPEATRKQIRPQDPEFLAAALVVTSRTDEPQLGLRTRLQPILLNGKRVSAFVEAYLAQQGHTGLYANDEDFFNDCRLLSRMVGEREITPLLAKLYVDQLVTIKKDGLAATMPESIPELMLRYLDLLHPNQTPQILARVQHDAKEVAWQCLKETFYPAAVDRTLVVAVLPDEDASDRLAYLESSLRIVRTEGKGHNRIRFTLDPLAEYLAGLKVVEMYKGNETHWRSFLKRADERPLEKIASFMLAVRDCCLAATFNVPKFIPTELARRGGIDLEN